MRTYSELIRLPTFEERFEYLRLDGVVGESTFGFDRYLNQIFYHSEEWKAVRREVILRDSNGDCVLDLGCDGHEIFGRVLIHHMNPISAKDIVRRADILLNPEYLISTMKLTHDAIHYGDESLLAFDKPIVRKPNDTCPWRRQQ